MKTSNDKSLGEVIREMIETYRMEGKLNEIKVIHSWEKVVGVMIAKYTKDLHIRNGKLFVKIESPALKNELTYSSSVIIERLNKEAGAKVIEEIIFT
jgi:predicted nucleic acid-binding Zn ribbon protein